MFIADHWQSFEVLDTGDGEKLAAFFADSFSEYETKEHIAAYLAELTRGKELSLQTMSSGLDSAVQYAVKCDGKKFAAFSLKKSGEKTTHGIDLYTLDAAQPEQTAEGDADTTGTDQT